MTLANIASAKKRARQMVKRRSNNASHRSLLRTQIKKVLAAIEAKDKEAANNAFKEATPVIDRMANMGIIHKNKAARHKSQLNAQLRAM
jgi:small subunit ribosomal protein S20